MSLRLSVLDLSPISSGMTAGRALENTVDLARHAESLGLERYWLAEHHNAGSLASSAPEIMIAQVASATKSIRVGSGGMMLPNHAPLKVAELFRVLHALFPDRIDLGLGRAAGTDPRTALALRRAAQHASADDFPEQFSALVGFLEDDDAPRSAFARSTRAIPVGVPCPALWMLGSSDYGGAFAAAHGLPFAFAHHINPQDAVVTMKRYRAEFRPSKYASRPTSILAVAAACADNEDDARIVGAGAHLAALRFSLGLRDLPYPSPEEAEGHEWNEEDRALAVGFGARAFVGHVRDVAPRIRALAEQCEADEVMVMTHVFDHDVRKKSYSLLRDALG